MKIMTTEFVTLKTFNKSMKNIDQRFDVVSKDTEDLRIMIREVMEEQRVFFRNEMKQYIGVIVEEFNERFKSMMEHPVFANYKS